jgi:hypothetical protein
MRQISMIEALNCPAAFNIPEASSLYAQIAGVLAGFAFAAMVLLLTPAQNYERKIARRDPLPGSAGSNSDQVNAVTLRTDKGILLSLLASILALVVTAVTYSVLAGEPFPQAQGPAATEELIDGVPFSLAIMLLFHGLTLLIDNANISTTAVRLSRVMTVIIVPTIAMFALVNSTSDTESVRLAEHASTIQCTGAATVPPLGLALTILLIAILSIFITIGRRIESLRMRLQRLQATPPITIVIISVGSALLSGFVSTRSDNFIMTSWIENLYLVIIAIALGFIGVVLAVSGRGEQPTKNEHIEVINGGLATGARPAVPDVSGPASYTKPPSQSELALTALRALGGQAATHEIREKIVASGYTYTHEQIRSALTYLMRTQRIRRPSPGMWTLPGPPVSTFGKPS